MEDTMSIKIPAKFYQAAHFGDVQPEVDKIMEALGLGDVDSEKMADTQARASAILATAVVAQYARFSNPLLFAKGVQMSVDLIAVKALQILAEQMQDPSAEA